MPTRSMHEDDPLEDFTRREITLDCVPKGTVTKVVHTAGTGPAVIVMAEMPGGDGILGSVTKRLWKKRLWKKRF